MSSKEVITVDINQTAILAGRGKDIVFTPEAEEALLTLLDLQDRVNDAVELAKKKIEEVALDYNPNFTAVQSDKIKAGYQFFGSKYAIDDEHFKQLPVKYYKTRVTHSPDSKAVDEHIKIHGALPLGVREKQRSKKVTFKRKEDFHDVQE